MFLQNFWLPGSIAAIVFSSDSSVEGTGFFLKFTASGLNVNSKYVYNLRHIGESNGTIEYPASDRNNDDITKQHIYITAKCTTVDMKSSPGFKSGIDLSESIFLKANDSSCVYDSLTFYEPLVAKINEDVIHVWQKKAQIQNENDTVLCPQRLSVPQQKRFLEFGADSFLAVYKQVSKNTIESNKAVSFDYYYKAYKCVEILQPLKDDYGIIMYQEGNYKYEEDCSWIIEVTNATGIDFNLEQSGFEYCCEYVTVTSLDMGGQVQGPTLRLRAGSPTASVAGSRALAKFITASHTILSGFRLRYESGISLSNKILG